MTDTADVVRSLNAKFQMSWMQHGLHLGMANADTTAFREEMITAFGAAARDPAAFLAGRASQSRGGEEQPAQAEQPSRLSSAEDSGDHGWAAAFAKFSGRTPSEAA